MVNFATMIAKTLFLFSQNNWQIESITVSDNDNNELLQAEDLHLSYFHHKWVSRRDIPTAVNNWPTTCLWHMLDKLTNWIQSFFSNTDTWQSIRAIHLWCGMVWLVEFFWNYWSGPIIADNGPKVCGSPQGYNKRPCCFTNLQVANYSNGQIGRRE